MKLTLENDADQLRRYRHLKRARGWRAERCGRRCPQSDRTCSRPIRHSGPHAAHGRIGRLLAVWDSSAGGDAERSRSSSLARPGTGGKAGRRRPVGLRARSNPGVVARAKAVSSWIGSHAEEIFLLAFFIAFVWFAVDWLTIIFR